MEDRFIAMPLAVRQIDQAFPIVQSIQPTLPIDHWRRFAVNVSALGTRRAGIMTAQRGGYIHGLYSYAVEPHIAHRRLLVVDNFVALDLFDPGGVTDVLLASMETLATELDCSAMHTNLPHSDGYEPQYRRWLIDRFTGRGHHAENLLFCKNLADGREPSEGRGAGADVPGTGGAEPGGAEPGGAAAGGTARVGRGSDGRDGGAGDRARHGDGRDPDRGEAGSRVVRVRFGSED